MVQLNDELGDETHMDRQKIVSIGRVSVIKGDGQHTEPLIGKPWSSNNILCLSTKTNNDSQPATLQVRNQWRFTQNWGAVHLLKYLPRPDQKLASDYNHIKIKSLPSQNLFVIYMRTKLLHTRNSKVLCVQYCRIFEASQQLSACTLCCFCINTEKAVKQQHAVAFTGGKYCMFSLKQVTELHLCSDIFFARCFFFLA